ncbi:helix-turn-helix transcriptional regulator [Streptacidiphilus cavernicola]|uniref:HTH luxR-type domain-containing protein n=1 Tax=Streptacidiphilus cavernicola TaxID=3342716 RepID=A0ABV6W4W4_9ACTN
MIDPPVEIAGRRALREAAVSVGAQLDDAQVAVMTRALVLTLELPRPSGVRPVVVASGIGLDETELALLRLLAYDLSDAEICRQRGLARTALRVRLRGLFVKLGVESRLQAVAVAYETGILGGGHSGPMAGPVSPPAALAVAVGAAGRPVTLNAAEVPSKAFGLTGDQLQVLRLVADGLDNLEIGYRLDLTRDQVKHRMQALYRASGALSRTALPAWGRRVGLLGGEQR